MRAKKNMDSLTTRDHVRLLHFENKDVTQADVAAHLGLSEQSYSYLLNNAVKFDNDVYESIKKYFVKRGKKVSSKEENGRIQSSIINYTGMLGEQIHQLHAQFQKDIEDGIYSQTEKSRMFMKIDDMETNLMHQLKKLKDLFRG